MKGKRKYNKDHPVQLHTTMKCVENKGSELLAPKNIHPSTIHQSTVSISIMSSGSICLQGFLALQQGQEECDVGWLL